jgi:hypothetical protein
MDDWEIALLIAGIGLLGVWGGAKIAVNAQSKATQVADDAARRSDYTNRSLSLANQRAAWIQRLRDEMALFQSWGMTPGLNHAERREFYEHGTRIELLMNPQDPDYQKLSELLNRLLEAASKETKYAVNAEFVEVCQRILKREWEVTKCEILGEPRL